MSIRNSNLFAAHPFLCPIAVSDKKYLNVDAKPFLHKREWFNEKNKKQ